MEKTKVLVGILLLLVLFIYIRYYASVVNQLKIVQLSVRDLTPSVLLSKNPIVINERIVNPISLLSTAFKYMYLFKHVKLIEDADKKDKFTKNKARYLLLSSNSDSCSISIINPRLKGTDEKVDDSPAVEIKLYENMCMILPSHWLYKLNEPQNTSSVSLEDIMSMTLGRIF